jgi:hypothetical protein
LLAVVDAVLDVLGNRLRFVHGISLRKEDCERDADILPHLSYYDKWGIIVFLK